MTVVEYTVTTGGNGRSVTYFYLVEQDGEFPELPAA